MHVHRAYAQALHSQVAADITSHIRLNSQAEGGQFLPDLFTIEGSSFSPSAGLFLCEASLANRLNPFAGFGHVPKSLLVVQLPTPEPPHPMDALVAQTLLPGQSLLVVHAPPQDPDGLAHTPRPSVV